MSFRYPQPSNEDDFELLCLRFLRAEWQCPTLQQYGKRGERQYGIDLIDEAGGQPLRAVQCKHHEPDKTIPPAEIQAEVAKALESSLPLDEYYILTTARKTALGQNSLISINRNHLKTGSFKVFLWTWSDIEERLSQMDDATQDRVLRGDSGRSGPAVCKMITSVMAEHLDRPLYSSASVLDLELDAVKALLVRHELEVAENKLKEIETRAADKLQAHHHYQVKTLRSKIYADRWDWKKAGRELIDAKRFMPDSERARVNEALGYELIGDREKAHSLATALRTVYPLSVRLLTTWARTATAETSFVSIAKESSVFVKDDEELNLALAHRAAVEGRYEDAIQYAVQATEIDGDSPHAWFVLGQAKHSLGYRTSTSPQMSLLREAEAHYDRAVQLSLDHKLNGLESAIRINRGKVRHVLGSKHADVDFARAVELARPDQGLRTEYASYLIEMDRYDDALRELNEDKTPPNTARLFYEAVALYGRNSGDDRKVATERLLAVINSEPSERWPDAHVFLVQCSVENKTQSATRAAIGGSKLREINPLVYHTLLGWLANPEVNTEGARQEFRTAIGHLSDQTPKDQVFLLAQALASVEEDEEALTLFLRCYRPGVFTLECRKLLGCAKRLNRLNILARVCRELREAGEHDPRLIQTELQTLQQYDPQQALKVAREYLGKHPNDRHVALWQSALALRLDQREFIIADLDRLPLVEDLSPEGTGLVLNVLNETGQQTAALRYAYDALRAHFDSEFAHGQYVAYFLKHSDHCPELRLGGTAGAAMAVCYREGRDDVDRWVVVEDSSDPELARNELGLDHPVSRALAGKHAGDTVVISDGGIQPRKATVREVFHKYIFRFRDCLNQFQIRFPGASAIQMVQVGDGDMFDPSPILTSLEDQRKHLEALDEQYRTQPIPLPTYAEMSGRNEFEAWTHLAASPDLGIRCFNGRNEDLRAGLEVMRVAKSVVLDLTAIYTLGNLGLLSVLGTSGRSFIVAHTTFERLQTLADEADENRTSEGSILVAEKGQLGLVAISAESRERYANHLRTLRDGVRESCKILPCPQAAELEPKRREDVVKVIGRHSLDSMLLASALGTTLWTDDQILGVLGLAEFRSSRVWTQAVLFVLQQDGVVTQLEYDQAVAKLVGWHYHGVLWNHETLIAAAILADWQMDGWPVPQVVRCLGNVQANPAERVQIAAEAIRNVWRRDLLSHQRQGFLIAVLNGLGSMRLVRRLAQLLPRLFSLDVFAVEETRTIITYWLSTPTRVIQP